MKRAITIRLCAVVLIGMLFTLMMSYYFQIKSAKDSMYQNSVLRIGQIEEILSKNSDEIAQLEENLKEDYIIRAKAAAYIIENYPEIENDLQELQKVAALLQVDELHLFNPEGTIYSGTQPKYYGYKFTSGEQMRYFLPLLEDYTLQMCQEITPNTAESKLMQYTALWREDHKGIVQIGMEPVRLMEAMQKNELPYLFSRMTVEQGYALYAIDGETGEILGSTKPELVGRQAGEVGLVPNGAEPAGGGFTTHIDGQTSYCVFQRQPDGLCIGVSSRLSTLYQNIPGDMTLSALSQALIAAAVILLIYLFVDRTIISGISTVIGKLTQITNGNLDTRVQVDSSPEFVQLSSHINQMVTSLLETTNKLSLVFQNVELPIAVFEYNGDMPRVMATSRLSGILMLREQESGSTFRRFKKGRWRKNRMAPSTLSPAAVGVILSSKAI